MGLAGDWCATTALPWLSVARTHGALTPSLGADHPGLTAPASKSIVRWVASQNGLLLEQPHRQSAICSRWGISRPSTSVRVTGPETRYGPLWLRVMSTSAMEGVSFLQQP